MSSSANRIAKIIWWRWWFLAPTALGLVGLWIATGIMGILDAQTQAVIDEDQAAVCVDLPVEDETEGRASKTDEAQIAARTAHRHAARIRHGSLRALVAAAGLLAVLVAAFMLAERWTRRIRWALLILLPVLGLHHYLLFSWERCPWFSAMTAAVEAYDIGSAALLSGSGAFLGGARLAWGLVWTGMIVVGLAMGAVLSHARDAREVREAGRRLRVLLFLGAGTLAAGVLAYSQLVARVALAFPVQVGLGEAEQAALATGGQDFVASLTLYAGVGFSIVLALAYLPIAMILMLRAEELADEHIAELAAAADAAAATEDGAEAQPPPEKVPTRDEWLEANDLATPFWLSIVRMGATLVPLLTGLSSL